MSLLNQKVLPALTGMREAKVRSFEEVENAQGGYVKVILDLGDRDYTYCIFPTQVEYVTGALRTQFDMQNESVTLGAMLEKAKTNTIKVWFSFNNDLGRMNVALHESKPRVVSEEAVEL